MTNRNLPDNNTQTAYLGNGCFWCTEAIFQQVSGVLEVISGYAGGKIANPTYAQVCTGETGHAECLRITYNRSECSFNHLLEVFWATHDPTTLNRQGNDIGTQYRSVVFFTDDEQKETAIAYKNQLERSGVFHDPIVTSFEPFTIFYEAENYHQDYYNLHSNEPYCRLVIRPKLEKYLKSLKP